MTEIVGKYIDLDGDMCMRQHLATFSGPSYLKRTYLHLEVLFSLLFSDVQVVTEDGRKDGHCRFYIYKQICLYVKM
jgi:hypothetical protein